MDPLQHTVIINLKRRPDRRRTMEAQLQQQGMTADFFDAVDGQSENVHKAHLKYTQQPLLHREEKRWQHHLITNPAMYGIMMSALTVVSRAFARDWSCVTIFEDDVLLCPQFKRRAAEFVNGVIGTRPWKVIVWGASDFHAKERRHGKGFYYASRGVYGFFAVTIHQSAYKEVLGMLQTKRLPPDVCLNCVYDMNPHRCYVANPNLAVARLDDSDIHPYNENRLVTREGISKETQRTNDFYSFQQDYYRKTGWDQLDWADNKPNQ